MALTIAIDAFQDSSKITGTDRMAANFLTSLQGLDDVNFYLVICSREHYIRSRIHAPNFHIISPRLSFRSNLLRRAHSFFWRRTVWLWLRYKNVDTYYSFHNMRLPSFRVASKMIASNLDLIPIVLDEYKGLGRTTYEKQLGTYKRVALLADKFMSISQFSKNELYKQIGVPKEKVEVIHLAADPVFNSRPAQVSPKMVDGAYIFTTGGSEPRKNVQTVIEAYKTLPHKMQDKYKLVIGGGSWHGRELEGVDGKNIINLGYFPDEALPGLYGNASAFVFASVYEGFGFTILEAMASGAPVITAHGSSLDEVAGNAVLMFDPKNVKELAEKMELLLSDESLQKKLISKGEEQNKKFSWEEAGNKLHKILTADSVR